MVILGLVFMLLCTVLINQKIIDKLLCSWGCSAELVSCLALLINPSVFDLVKRLSIKAIHSPPPTNDTFRYYQELIPLINRYFPVFDNE